MESTEAAIEEAAEATEAAAEEAAEAAEAAAVEATEAAAEAASTIVFWEGETDKGDTLLYSEVENEDVATIILSGNHDGQEEALAFSGPVTTDEATNTITITDSETGDAFSFQITGATSQANGDAEDTLTVDMGDHGTATLRPVTEQQFEEGIEDVLGVVNTVGEQLSTLEEQQVDELFTILGGLLDQ